MSKKKNRKGPAAKAQQASAEQPIQEGARPAGGPPASPVRPIAAPGEAQRGGCGPLSWAKAHPAAVAMACLAAALAALAIACAVCFGQAGERQTAAEEAHAELQEQVEAAHVHTWQKDTELVHHDAVTRTIEHPATYETVMVNHTVCNTCSEIADGATDAHEEETGHSGFTTGVPVPETRLKSAAWTETVTDEPAYDELVALTETCADCGAVRDLPADGAEGADE